MKLIKSFPVEFKESEAEEGILEGYASVWDVVDAYGDIVKRGAFKKTLQERLPKNRIKVFFDHHTPVGVLVDAKEDETGLWTKAKIANTQLGKDLLELVRLGALDSMSIGYDLAGDSHNTPNKHGGLDLGAIKLMEVSYVGMAANEEAVLTGVKSLRDEQAELRREFAALVKAIPATKYDPGQPRDEDGQWTDGVNGISLNLDRFSKQEFDQDQGFIKELEENYKEDASEMPPIVVIGDEDGGRILDGHHRFVAAQNVGADPPRAFLSEEEFEALENEGYDGIEIAAAVQYANENYEEFDAIDDKFGGVVRDRAEEAWEILEGLREKSVFGHRLKSLRDEQIALRHELSELRKSVTTADAEETKEVEEPEEKADDSESVSVGDFVKWGEGENASQGKVEKIVTDGPVEGISGDAEVIGSEDDPAALIQVYRDGEPTETYVGHKASSLSKAEMPEGDSEESEESEDKSYPTIEQIKSARQILALAGESVPEVKSTRPEGEPQKDGESAEDVIHALRDMKSIA